MFHDVRLREDVERGARGGPRFKTTVVEMGSGFEQRNQDWQFARAEYDISYGIMDHDTYSEVVEFFNARRGRAFGFRFKDWSDYEAEDVLIGTGDGSTVEFQLIKAYSDAASTYNRTITRPVNGTLTITVDGVTQTEGAGDDYTVDYSTGVVTFNSAPAVGLEVRATFEFDVPVRFDVDHLDLDVVWYDAASIPELVLREIRE